MIIVNEIEKQREYTCNSCIVGIGNKEIKFGREFSFIVIRLCIKCENELKEKL